MNIEELKQNRIVAGTRTMPAVVITLTGGAATYCIYKGVEQAVKKVDEKTSTKNACLSKIEDVETSYYIKCNTDIRRTLELSIGDICLSN